MPIRMLLISLISLILARCAIAQPQTIPLDQKQRAEDLTALANTAERSTITLSNGARAKLSREPAYRWSNSLGTSIGRHVKDAALFIWVADERPVAVTTVVWYSELGMFQEFLSLSTEPLTASRGLNAIWAPVKSGVAFQPVPDAPTPANHPAGRLSQMKALARRFHGEVVKGPPTYPEGSIWQLRVLPTPLIRYGAPEKTIGDGAVFALCQDSDPEICLMLEVRGNDEQPVWSFATAPLTSRELRVSFDDNVVWTKPMMAPANDSKRPYYVLPPSAAP